jgi:hypothetical protein
MNNKLQQKLSALENIIGIQTDCVQAGDPGVQYMHGMLNGLICAHSIFADCEPRYVERPRRFRQKNIRHKSQFLKRK